MKDRVFYYGDTREAVEKALGTESKAAMEWLDKYRRYPDGTQVLYRKAEEEEQAVLIMVKWAKLQYLSGTECGRYLG